jgi:two-component sensor histidine kinase
LNEVGFVHENMKQFNKALIYYEEAKKIWSDSKQLRNWVLVTENIARTYRKMGQYAKSTEIVTPAEKIAKERKWYSNLLSIYILKGGNYVLLNNLTEAKNYDHFAMSVKLINYQENNLRAIKEIKAKYETEKKEELIREKNEQIKNSREKLKVEKEGQRKLYTGIFILLILLILVAYLAINRAVILRQLKSKTKQLEVSNKNLNVSLAKSEVLLQEVHHRVKNNLQFITSIIELEIDSNSPSSKKESLVDVSRRISAMSLVHELLYNNDNIEKIAAKKYIDDLVISIDEMINRQQIPIHFELKIEDVLFEVKQCIAVGMIISELVSNSIKHAFQNQKMPKITILLSKNELSKTIQLKVSDNGSGISEEGVIKKGLGSRLVHIFTIQLNGQYIIESKNQFSFNFEFPYIE